MSEIIGQITTAGEIIGHITGGIVQGASLELLSAKADKTYVDAQDALKADKTYVDTQDALKADKTTTVNTKPLSGNISLTATDIPSTPSGGISATDVQTAINELDNEKASKSLVPSEMPLQTVANRNQYYPVVKNNNGDIIGRHITQLWNGTAWVGNNSFGFGNSALISNTGTNANGFGSIALQNNTGAYANGFGSSALYTNSGERANGFGYTALYANTGAYANGFGSAALFYNSGLNANGFGSLALYSNSGVNSNGFGHLSLQNNTGANANGFGYATLRYNTGTNNTAVGDSANTIFIENTAGNKTFDATAVDIATEQITITGHGFGANGTTTLVKYASTTGTAIGGLSVGTPYQVVIVDANTIKVTVNLTSQGTGTHTFTPSANYTNTTCLGASSVPNRSNQVVLGSTAVDTVKMGGAYRTPASGTAEGVKGETCWDANYFYICVATNTWKRIALTAW